MDLPRYRHTIGWRLGPISALTAFLLLGLGAPLGAQRVRIEFNDYHGYDGTVDYIRDVADEYPNITELLEIGESN
ncbi:MAG: hypothetical protein PVJ04_16105, partial [Gemmatimonadota bacterium]